MSNERKKHSTAADLLCRIYHIHASIYWQEKHTLEYKEQKKYITIEGKRNEPFH